jgi:hypothetical protein
VEYLGKVESQFTGSSKDYASSLIKRLVSDKYTSDSVIDHILSMSNVAARLKLLNFAIKDDFLITFWYFYLYLCTVWRIMFAWFVMCKWQVRHDGQQ